MARVVDEMPRPRGSGRAKYPWGEWLDGRVWLLDRDVDFPGVNDFRPLIYDAATRHGKRASVNVRPEGIYVQAVPR